MQFSIVVTKKLFERGNFEEVKKKTTPTQLTLTRSKSTIETSERLDLRRSRVFIVNSGHISHIFLVFLLLTLNKEMLAWKFLLPIRSGLQNIQKKNQKFKHGLVFLFLLKILSTLKIASHRKNTPNYKRSIIKLKNSLLCAFKISNL